MDNVPMTLNNTPFATFAKGKVSEKVKTNNCVIYTRVSDIKQVDNLSLEVQLKYSQQFAKQKGLEVRAVFGGTHESAKTDERKEFCRMLDYVKKSKGDISYILVYSMERFSRSENSIWQVNELRKLGVEIISVTQPIDTSNPSGQMQQKIMLIFGEHDNQLRRQKCMAGTKERLLKGEWCNKAPIGYDHVRVNGERKIVVNATGKLIKKAFMWKLNEDCSLTEIKNRLEKEGLKFNRLGKVSEMLTNPFYCGILTHSALEGQVVEGKHEKLISKEIFLRVNKLYGQNSMAGYKVVVENEQIPLKRFLRCNECHEPLRGYIAKQWNLPYYKCNNKGCKNNRNANIIHQQFMQELQHYTVDATLQPVVKDQLTQTLQHLVNGQKENEAALIKKREEVYTKLERLEERFVMEEITSEQYHKFAPKLKEEHHQITMQLEKAQVGVSKWEEAVEKVMELCLNLPQLWQQSDYTQKQKLQYLVFPDGMLYDRKNDLCRSLSVNPVFSYIADLTRGLGEGESGVKKICEENTVRSP